MSPGPDPDPSWEDYKEAVEYLYEQGETNASGGVPPRIVAAELDVPESTARYHLDGMVENGELKECYHRSRPQGGRPPRGFAPLEKPCKTVPI